MIYIPMLKTRSEELRIAADVNECFSTKIIPLFEVISEKYRVRYKTNEKGEFIRERHKTRTMKVKCEPTEEDIITLSNINEIVNNNKVFVDYFRFSAKKYGKKVDARRAGLAYELSGDYFLYKKKLLAVTVYDNMIPVISIKEDYDIEHSELRELIVKIQQKTAHIALRITDGLLDMHNDIIVNCLRKQDYLLYDLEENNPELKYERIKQLKGDNLLCRIILLNSPRKSCIKNVEYPVNDVTDLINNCARNVAEECELDGYGDYCGLMDDMPIRGGANGTGAALVLFYNYEDNVFYSYCNHNSKLGKAGYKDIIPLIRKDEKLLDPLGECPGFRKMHEEPVKNWNTWNYVNAARYIYQIYKNL